MINCIVVDDEPLARQLILSYITQIEGIECLGSYQTAVEAFAGMHQHQVDVIFIDIEMPGINGLNFIKSLKKLPRVIFITAYTEYAVEAFEIEATDYMVKPVTFERFLKAVQKIGLNRNKPLAENNPAQEISNIFLKVDRRLVKVDLISILFVEALGDYLKVHTVDRVHITYMALGKLETLLPAGQFIRIHRSIIVNKGMIQFVEGNFVRVNDTDLPIGLTYKEKLMKNLVNL